MADNFIMAGMFLTLFLVCNSRWCAAPLPHPHTADAVTAGNSPPNTGAAKRFRCGRAGSLAVAVAVVASRATSALVMEDLRARGRNAASRGEVLGNRYIHVTFWSTVAATLFHGVLARLHGADKLGAYLLYVFVRDWFAGHMHGVLAGADDVLFCLVIAVTNLVVHVWRGAAAGNEPGRPRPVGQRHAGRSPIGGGDGHSLGWSKLVLPAC